MLRWPMFPRNKRTSKRFTGSRMSCCFATPCCSPETGTRQRRPCRPLGASAIDVIPRHMVRANNVQINFFIISINVSGEFVTGIFRTESTNGSSLRYWFKNDGKENCTVRLYKKGTFGDSMVSSMTVSPSDPGGKSAVYKNPGNGRYYKKVSAQYGGAIKGHLRANHTDL